MKGLKRLGLGAAALGAVLTIAGFVAGSVLAVSGSISLSSGSAAPGESGTVELSSDVGDPGLGAWTVDISYDSSVATVADCDPEEGGVCNPEFAPDTIRITGASASGLEGDTLLGTLTFDCADEEGTTDLTMVLDVFADSTIGDPQPIEPATINDGEFACEVPAPVATGTPLPAPGPVGSGPSDSGTNWVIVALVGAGLVGLTSLTAFRLSARRS